jgi:CRP-like cAMP-binding protein
LIPEFTELQKLMTGKSFGEKALITNSLRAANVVCSKDCHFATVAKQDYDRVLRKIELKVQNKIIAFLQ